MSRIIKIKRLYKIAQSSSNILKTKTKDVQEALINAGYELPRFGADGEFGKETLSALMRFKKDNNLESSPSLSESEFALLKSKAINQVDTTVKDDSEVSGSSRPTITDIWKSVSEKRIKNLENETKKGETLLFGDSQMQGGIGQVLQARFGGERIYMPGKQASYWVTNGELESKLKKKPENIIVQLNGNGISGTKELMQKIKKITPESKITWYGAPPATISRGSSFSKVRNEDSLRSFNNSRRSNNINARSIIEAIDSNATFIDPFDQIFDMNGKSIPYSCNNCDGVHVPKSIAQIYYS